MKTVGIISEYNPFHEGHAYHIRRAKELTGADHAVVIMNGDFMQRGEPAVTNKYVRTEQALEGGADLVLELPVRFGISSAGDFCHGGILALESLGFVDSVCFGSECGRLEPFLEAAGILADEPPAFQSLLSRFLRQGMSYPSARSLALREFIQFPPELLQSPNNILAVEYCVALRRLSSSMRPVTIPRIGQDYHGTEKEDGGFPSSSAIRQKIRQSGSPHLILEDFSQVIGYALLANRELVSFKDISPALADRISKFLPEYHSVSAFVRQCVNYSLTSGRIRRALLQCLIGLKETRRTMPYLRLLGMREECSSLLQRRDPDSPCRILTRLAAGRRSLGPEAADLLALDIFASDLYRQIWCQKYDAQMPNEYQRSPIIIR